MLSPKIHFIFTVEVLLSRISFQRYCILFIRTYTHKVRGAIIRYYVLSWETRKEQRGTRKKLKFFVQLRFCCNEHKENYLRPLLDVFRVFQSCLILPLLSLLFKLKLEVASPVFFFPLSATTRSLYVAFHWPLLTGVTENYITLVGSWNWRYISTPSGGRAASNSCESSCGF